VALELEPEAAKAGGGWGEARAPEPAKAAASGRASASVSTHGRLVWNSCTIHDIVYLPHLIHITHNMNTPGSLTSHTTCPCARPPGYRVYDTFTPNHLGQPYVLSPVATATARGLAAAVVVCSLGARRRGARRGLGSLRGVAVAVARSLGARRWGAGPRLGARGWGAGRGAGSQGQGGWRR
jgi:hypothetical protein